MTGREFDPKKPKTGALFAPRRLRENGPRWVGHLILADGSVVGVAAWVKETKAGQMLSLSVDDIEGAYQAKRLGLQQFGAKPAVDEDEEAEIPF